MKFKMLPILLLGIASSANVYSRPQGEGERAETGPRFGVGQTRPHEYKPVTPQSAPRQMPPTPRSDGNAGQQRSQPPHWWIDRGSGNSRGNDHRSNNNGDWNNRQRNDYGRHWSDNHWSGERGRDHYKPNRYDDYRAKYYRYGSGRYYARQRFSIGSYFLPRGYSTRVWYVGDWLPYDYYADVRYHLGAPWSYNLYDPPIGCHWIRVGADALLIDYYSGEVLEAVYSLFW